MASGRLRPSKKADGAAAAAAPSSDLFLLFLHVEGRGWCVSVALQRNFSDEGSWPFWPAVGTQCCGGFSIRVG